MHHYGVRDVEKLLGLSRSTIRALIQAGFVSPARGRRNAWLFSFQDLIVLRTARGLVQARVPHKRITQSIKELRRRLPDTMPLSGLNICAVGDRVVVREGGRHWQAESGQYLLAFEGDPAQGSLSVMESSQPSPAEDWFGRALMLESDNLEAAIQAYERAIADNPTHRDAHLNLGALLHQAGRLEQAERAYQKSLEACGSDAELMYNLGVLLEDMGRPDEARQAYEEALRGSPDFADCHYNLALLYEALGRRREAIRHMARYRRLSRR